MERRKKDVVGGGKHSPDSSVPFPEVDQVFGAEHAVECKGFPSGAGLKERPADRPGAPESWDCQG